MTQQAPISDVVDVQVTLVDGGVEQAGFGVPMILGDNGTYTSERIRAYSSLLEVAEDFESSDEEYLMAAAIFAQAPHPTSIKIGIEAARVAQIATIVFSGNLVTSNVVSTFTVGSETVTATNFNTSNAQTLTDLAAKIQALTGIATAVSNGTNTITLTAASAGVPFTISAITVTAGSSQATVTRTTTTPNHGVADDLAEIQEIDDEWYGLLWTEQTAVQVAQAAAYIEAQSKIYITVSADANVLSASSTTDIAYVLSAATYQRTAVIYNATASDYADAAWMGNRFVKDPGTENWKFVTLAGITVDSLTTSQRNAALNKNCNIYVKRGGENKTEEGTMAGGRFIDLTRLVDWLTARVGERVLSILQDTPTKIAYTSGGISLITKEIRAVLQNGVESGAVSSDPLPTNTPPDQSPYKVTAPTISSISSSDKASRVLHDITFTCVASGAINKVFVNGTVTV